MLKIYNTLTKKKRYFYKTTNVIKIYVCGITVHDYCHIGHARIFIFFDFVIRYFKSMNYKIMYIRNITDVDDKIIDKSKNNHVSTKHLSEKYTYKMYKDFKNLKIIEPTFEPKATNFINNMIEIINILKIKEYAYVGKTNDIYYNISKNKTYGKLAGKNIKDLIPGYRIKKNKNKNYNLDFTLWKISENKKNSWKSPWGIGRPGWHTECVAMSNYYFKETIDIHGGGKDLIFPHHENELAQHKIIKKKDLAKFWIHIGHININKIKMSKSLRNSLTIKQVLKQFHEEYLRFLILSTHYKSDIEYSINNILNAKKSLNSIYTTINNQLINNKDISKINIKKTSFVNEFFKTLNNDLNTPKAISILFKINKKLKHSKNNLEKALLTKTIVYLGNILGILKENPKTFLENKIDTATMQEKINNLIKKRNIARKLKNWKLADKIRDKLKKINIKIEDNKIETIIKET